MQTIYKYMPLRDEFFDDPLFRITPPTARNDPFDSKPTKEAIRRKIAFLTDEHGEGAGFVSDDEITSKHSGLSEYLETELHKYGIVSLSENPHNLLMWSHYADEHSGMVVELNNDKGTFCFSSEPTDDDVSSSTAYRVIYDSKRPSKNIPDECIYSIYEDPFFKHFALVKSDDWMYEKEHRFIIPLTEADVTILRKKYSHP